MSIPAPQLPNFCSTATTGAEVKAAAAPIVVNAVKKHRKDIVEKFRGELEKDKKSAIDHLANDLDFIKDGIITPWEYQLGLGDEYRDAFKDIFGKKADKVAIGDFKKQFLGCISPKESPSTNIYLPSSLNNQNNRKITTKE